jgi:hypothetical protein
MVMNALTAERPQERTVLEAFWHTQAALRREHVELLTEVNVQAGGSLCAAIGHRYLIWEAWGTLTQASVTPTLQAIADAVKEAAIQGTRLAGFFDLSRVEIFDDAAQKALIAWRRELEPSLAFDRTAVIFGTPMSQITYNMAALLQPSAWEERVFPSIEEALIWLQDPINTELIDVDGLSWIV